MRQLHPQPATSVSIAVCVGDWGVIFRRHRRYRYTDDTLCCTEYRVVSDYSVRAMLKLNKHRVCLGWHRTCVFLPSMRPLLASASLLLGRRCSLLVRHVMRHAPCMQARLRAPLPGGAHGARPLPSIGRAELCASAPASRRAAKQQASARKQRATRPSSEQIEKEQRTTAARA